MTLPVEPGASTVINDECMTQAIFEIANSTATCTSSNSTGIYPMETNLARKVEGQMSTVSLPYHVLMLDGNDNEISPDLNCHKRKVMILDRRFKTDYLSLRYRAFQDAKPKENSENNRKIPCALPENDEDTEKWWCGASPLERALASCCTLHPDDYVLSGSFARETNVKSVNRKRKYAPSNEDDEDLVAGALSLDKISKFIGLLSMHCHDVSSRALALAILEQTQEADEIEIEDRFSYISTSPPRCLDIDGTYKNSRRQIH
jgi:hypothetical protein